jgi:aspartyl-tRNA synthetase
MSFVEEEDVMSSMDGLIRDVFSVAGVEVSTPIERLTYDEVTLRYGSDRPDRRIGMEIVELSDVFAGSGFQVFSSAPCIRGIKVSGEEFTRRRFDELTEFAKSLGAKGLVWAVLEAGDEWRSPISKFLSVGEMNGAAKELGARHGDVLFLVADEPSVVARVLGGIRSQLGEGKGEGHDLLWVTDFPMFEWDDDEKRPVAMHHPFTAPTGDLDGDPMTWRSRAYDIVMDGTEIGGGSIRINTPDVQQKVFEAIGLGADEARERFGFLLEALDYGAPPHGGIAFGLDRIVALLAGKESIRDVMAFPKTATASDLMTGAPSDVDERQLRDLGLRLT